MTCAVSARLIKRPVMMFMGTAGHKWGIYLQASGPRMLCVTLGWRQCFVIVSCSFEPVNAAVVEHFLRLVLVTTPQ